jgi:hypothetical protein
MYFMMVPYVNLEEFDPIFKHSPKVRKLQYFTLEQLLEVEPILFPRIVGCTDWKNIVQSICKVHEGP